MKKNLKKKFLAVLCSAATAASMLPAVSVIPVMADASKVVSIGNDLTDAQKKTMMRYFGIENDKSVQQITVTNKDEISHLSSYIPLEQIGTRTVSCAYIKQTNRIRRNQGKDSKPAVCNCKHDCFYPCRPWH